MNQNVLKDRLKKWAISTIHFIRKLPSNTEFKVVRYQLIKSSSSSAANHRAACRGRSTADFVNKLKIVEEELDESLFWFEFIEGISDDFNLEIQPLYKEGDELLSIYCRFNKNY